MIADRAQAAARPASEPPTPTGEGDQRWPRRLADLLLGRAVTLGLAVGALVLGVLTFAELSGGTPFGPARPGQVAGLVLINLAFVLLLAASLIARLVRMWLDRRRGSAGSRLHVRLVALFGLVAVVPAMLVTGFAAAFFNYGIQAWFSDTVRTALEASLAASRAYLEEHRGNIRGDALQMAADLNRAARIFLLRDGVVGSLSSASPEDGLAFARQLAIHTQLRGLTDAYVFDPAGGQVIASAGGLAGSVLRDPPPVWALELARSGDVVLLPAEQEGRARALVQLDIAPGYAYMLLISRPLDPAVIAHMERTEAAVARYEALERNRSGLQISFLMIFAIASLLLLLAAVLIGLVFANQLARPISRLIQAAERVRSGDLTTRVEEGRADDEVASLSRAFNRMTSQLSAQRGELMEAYRQIDERRRFTETVLSGVSAGVIGLDADGRVNLPNRSASSLLGVDLDAAIGLPIAEVVLEFAPLLEAAQAQPERPHTAELRIGPPSNRRTLLAQLGAEMQGGRVAGHVVTFDDITELLSAQRKAAWADVARRIAHEIKNPLTPIQLSAERLKRKYLKEITSDPDTFRACTDTIVRQVGDIGRMVDEFSAFARMPQPVIRPENLGKVVREALVLHQNAHAGIVYTTRIPEERVTAACDRRLIGQALTNLLQNAADAIQGQDNAGADGVQGHITLSIESDAGWVRIAVEDDGPGLPQGEERDRLTEPYVTHKAKGTGLGLAIVKKIMEDHGGRLALEDRGAERGARAVLILPSRPADAADGEQPAMEGTRLAHGA
ncbi:MAG TPA: PAS domain-containing sensor histidine kinase [Roseomonas sp.]|jgi:two-component system nitrogen regulation sensor histidine kinase NtrY